MDRNGIIVVTGASRGIGAGIAAALARHGFRIACLSRKGVLPAGLEAAEAERCITAVCDVTERNSLSAAMDKIAAAGPITGLVNNAGVHLHGPSESFSLDDYQNVMQTNVTAVFMACQEAYPRLKQAGGGLIVNIGSFFDKLGVKRNLAYCASKAAVGAITRCLAVEWADKGIRVVDVAPGYIVTDLNREAMAAGQPLRAYLDKRIPAGRPGTVDDVADLVAALYVHDLPFLSGETIYVDGAQGIAH
jgi:NAD(P)-dependent dehydrogenase (short-subunit alcohol dehydrogenase family)